MDRKTFLKTSMQATLGSCGAVLSFQDNPPSSVQILDDCPACTPCSEKVEFSKTWVKRFMDILDTQLDLDTRQRIMVTAGQTCYRGAHGEPKESEQMDLDVFISRVQQYVGKENCYGVGKEVHFNYVQNPRGLKISDGYCLCPIVEDGPQDLSPTFCQCSVGYVGELFGRVLGYAPRVELLQSLRRGGSGCQFLIHLEA